MNFDWHHRPSHAMKEVHHIPMTKRFLTHLSILLSAGLLHAQNSSAPSGTPDINKVISAAIAKGGSSSSTVSLKDPVAVVNGEKISKADLEKGFNEALAASGQANAPLTADQKMQGYRQILDGMIMEKLVDKQAAAVKVDKTEIDAQLAKIKSQFPSQDVFEGEMKKAGLTMDQFVANLTKSIRQTKWMQAQVAGKDNVTEDDAKKFYDANTKEFANPDLVRASHILFRVAPDASPAQQKIAENKAKAAIVRANKGEDFNKLAAELSEEPGAAQRGGDLGYFPKDKMVPAFADAAFSQKVGTVSSTPVKTNFGYHVIKVSDKKPAGTATFEEAKAQIMQFLQAQKRRQVFQGVMQELRQGAKIENNLPPAPSAPTAAPLK
jgi:peptidyl-prolyl cis-trans isomerase C